MTLPVTLTSAEVGAQNSYHGPFKSGAGGFYTIVPNSSGFALAFKADADDPTDAFTVQDSGNSPGLGNSSVNVFQYGDNLHVAVQDSSDDEVSYQVFDMSADTWDGGTIVVDNAPDGAADACDIVVLSTGKIRIVYQGAVDMDKGSDYERIDESNSVNDGVTWSAPTQIDNGASVAARNYTGPRIVLPPNNSDQCHVFMLGTAASAAGVAQIAIAGNDTLRTYRENSKQAPFKFTHGIGFMRASTSKVRIGFREAASGDLEVLEFDAFSDDTDRTETFSIVSTDDSVVDACLAVDGSTIRGLMIKVTGDDLFEFYDDDADSYTLQGSAHVTGTVNHVSCNVYDRDGNTKLAMIYDDAGTIKYDEISISAITVAVLDGVDMAQQNLFHGPFEI